MERHFFPESTSPEFNFSPGFYGWRHTSSNCSDVAQNLAWSTCVSVRNEEIKWRISESGDLWFCEVEFALKGLFVTVPICSDLPATETLMSADDSDIVHTHRFKAQFKVWDSPKRTRPHFSCGWTRLVRPTSEPLGHYVYGQIRSPLLSSRGRTASFPFLWARVR